MTDLIKKLEALEAPCRECDALIESERRRYQAYAVGVGDNLRAYWVADKNGNVSSQGTEYPARHFTASIGAAMTVVPEGCDWLRKDFGEMSVVFPVDTDKGWARHVDGYHKHPAIALCIAALRAQEASNAGR
jgi:hypothetical protein